MASTIKVKRSAVQGKAPTTGNLDAGELALNTRDGRLYSKGTQVFEVGANNHSLYVGTGGATFANGAFSLPTSDGTADQVIKTNGSGTLSWVDQSGGGELTGSVPFYAYDNTLDTINLTSQISSTALANTNAYIATKVDSSNPVITGTLSANGSVGTSGYVLKSAGSGSPAYWDAAGGSGFESGTLMLFQQTSAPTGWTKQTTHNDKALRVVSGTASSGGSVAFSTAMGTPTVDTSSMSAGSHTLTTAEMPSHTHTYAFFQTGTQAFGLNYASASYRSMSTQNYTSGSTGGGGSHSHSISGSATATINVNYVDIIIASKD